MIKFGDLIRIGGHTLLCGDGTEKVMVSEALSELIPQLMITDPPYGVKFTVRDRHSASTKLRASDQLEDIRVRNDHRTNWSKAFFYSQAKVAYIWHASTAADVAMQAIRDAEYEPRQAVVWVKHNFVLSRAAYHWQHESAVYAVRTGETANWKGDRKQTTVWKSAIPLGKERIHPTQKPVDLYTKPILNHTETGDLIYDPFVGSGTIFAAAQETGRIAVGIEIEPGMCDRILGRMEQQYGIKGEVIRNIFE